MSNSGENNFCGSKKSRWWLANLAIVFIFGVIIARLFYLQVVQHNYYVELASKQHMMQRELPARRGEIYMMDGEDKTEIVVMNERTWTVFVDPSYVASKESVQQKLSEVLGNQMIVGWDKVWSNMKNMYVEVARNVDYRMAMKVKEANLQGVGLKETSRRVYPSGEMAAQVLGFINTEGAGNGVEGAMNEMLSGKPGMLKTVTDVNSIPLSIGSDNIEIDPENGKDVVLTLDVNIQRKVESILKKAIEKRPEAIRAASAIVMDPMTGRVMAMANYPSYNPEQYWKVKDASVFQNRITESSYEPASTCKPFTYAIGLDTGSIRMSDTYYNSGKTIVADRTIWNANHSMAHTGEITFQEAINYSLNTGSVEVLRRIGGGDITKDARRTMYAYLTDKFGFGKKTGIELYEERGLITSPEDEQGNAVRYSNMTFGQGMSATMIQMVSGFSSMVNGGHYYQPTVVAGYIDRNKGFQPAEQKPALRDTISLETSVTIREALKGVRKVNGGRADPEGYNIGIKTGTAETLDENGKYTSDKTNASVIGYGGSGGRDSEPEYVIMVRLDGNALLWGAVDAVPVFGEISNYMIDYLRIQPNI